MRAIKLVKRELPWADAPGVGLIGRMKRAITNVPAAMRTRDSDGQMKEASRTFTLADWRTIIIPEYMCRAAIDAAEREIAHERVYHERRPLGEQQVHVYRMVVGDMCCGQKSVRGCNCNTPSAPAEGVLSPPAGDAWDRAHTNVLRVVVQTDHAAAGAAAWSFTYSETCLPAGGVYCTPPDERFRRVGPCDDAAFYALFVDVLKETFQYTNHVAQTDTGVAEGDAGVSRAMAMSAANDDLARLHVLYHSA